MLTEAEMLNLRLTIEKNKSTSDMIKHLIETDLIDEDKVFMRTGENYYYGKHDILDRKIYYYLGDSKKEDVAATNNKIPNPFHRNLVDQKVDKILGEDLTFQCEDETQLETTLKLFGENRHKYFKRLSTKASNKGVEAVHVMRTTDGSFKWVTVPAEQIIWVYDMKFEEDLKEVIRYYQIKEIINGKEETRWKVELWNDKQVTYYYEIAKDLYTLDPSEPINPRPHWIDYKIDSKGQVIKGTTVSGSWGRVPWIPFKNNDDWKSDLIWYKKLIDDYDLTTSDFSNTLADVQEVIWKLKGYQGQDLNQFMNDLKRYKAITVDADGDAVPERNEIPVDARGEYLDRTERNIHLFGRGVNLRHTDIIGNSPSGVALKFVFSLLELKCKSMKSSFDDSIKELLWFATQYLNETEKKKWDPKAITWIYNDAFVINESELIDNILKSQGILDNETILQKHPWVKDVQEVMDKIKNERIPLDLNADDENV